MLQHHSEREFEKRARLFSALGDSTRLKIVSSLLPGEKRSITQLTEGFALSRQAVTKHLRLLEEVGIVSGEKSGRESLYHLEIESLAEVREIIESIEGQWQQTLGRLKSLVER